MPRLLSEQAELANVQIKHGDAEHALRLTNLHNQLSAEGIRRFGPRLRVGFQPLIVLVASIIGMLPAMPNFLRLTFDSGLQSHERVIPLLPDEVERTARLFQPRAFKLPQALASHFDVAHQARTGQDMQVLRDRLAADVGSGCELCDRHRAFGA